MWNVTRQSCFARTNPILLPLSMMNTSRHLECSECGSLTLFGTQWMWAIDLIWNAVNAGHWPYLKRSECGPLTLFGTHWLRVFDYIWNAVNASHWTYLECSECGSLTLFPGYNCCVFFFSRQCSANTIMVPRPNRYSFTKCPAHAGRVEVRQRRPISSKSQPASSCQLTFDWSSSSCIAFWDSCWLCYRNYCLQLLSLSYFLFCSPTFDCTEPVYYSASWFFRTLVSLLLTIKNRFRKPMNQDFTKSDALELLHIYIYTCRMNGDFNQFDEQRFVNIYKYIYIIIYQFLDIET